MRTLLVVLVIASGCSQAPVPSATVADQTIKDLEARIAALEAKKTPSVPSVKDDPEFKSLADKTGRLAKKVESIRRVLEMDLEKRGRTEGDSNATVNASLLRLLEDLFPEDDRFRI